MASLDELKRQIKEEASDNPEKFFATDVLREKGFSRSECQSCGMQFWSFNDDRKVCGEPECSGGYTFINDSPTQKQFSYTESWNLFRDFMSDRGYTPIDRYPVVARWRDDVEFVGGSIYNFQPYVVSGEAEPPAPELVVPQPSLRFNDVDNVGITGRHYVLHNHIGQTCFREADEYDQDRYFRDMFEFAVEELGIPEEKLILHEDSWGGGGNLGACMEFFVDGLELWNQVYMFYEVTPEGYEELDLKVLDMGMGHERITWISHGTETSYECVMPHVLEKMKERTGLEVDQEIWEKFLPHSSLLNVDEVEDIDRKWEEIAEEIGIGTEQLKDEIKPVAAMYSVAEHSRALLFALADGKLPSNTGGGHNLRLVYRRAKDFIEKYGWDLDLKDVTEWNAEELEPIFPELREKLPEVKKILEVEQEKYEKAREKAREELERLDGQPGTEKMVELYESHGVSPEMMEEEGFDVPEDFYSLVASEDETTRAVEQKFDLKDIPETRKLYYERKTPYQEGTDTMDPSFKTEVKAVVEDDWIVLDETLFYPEGGGQLHDTGALDGFKVEEVRKQDNVILHRVPGHELEEGDRVRGVVDGERREQLTQHHSMTHALNGVTQELLGNHIYQAGAKKTVEKGRLDVTHYEKLGRDSLDRIEEEVREVIWNDLKITEETVSKAEAEKRYGFRIYQGGAPPGNSIRIIGIDGLDVEACGGTHLNSTSEAEEFVVTGSNKVQDGVIRIEFKAGDAAYQYIEDVRERVRRISESLGVEEPDSHRKAQRRLTEIFSVEPGQLEGTVENFREDLDFLRQKILKLESYLEEDVDVARVEGDEVVEKAESIFETKKQREKQLEALETRLENYIRGSMEDRVIEEEVPTENVGLLIQIARKLAKDFQASVTLVGEKGAVSASFHEEYDARENLEKYSSEVQGDERFAKAFDL